MTRHAPHDDDMQDGRKKRRRWSRGAVAALVAMHVAFLALTYFFLRPDVPSPKQMSRVVADLYTADAVLQERTQRGPADKTIERTYNTILRHHGLTKAQYDSAVAYYSKTPGEMSAIYERAIAILSEREARVKMVADKADSASRAVTAANDSLTVQLAASRPFVLSLPLADKADSLGEYLRPSRKRYDRVQVDVDLDSLCGGHIDLRHRYTVSKAVASSPRAYALIVVSYADSTETRDSLSLDATRRVTQRDAELSARLRDSVPAVRAQVTLFGAKDLRDMTMALRDIRLTYKPYDVVDTTDYDSMLPSLFAY